MKIHKIEVLEDVNKLNYLDYDIEILIIEELKLNDIELYKDEKKLMNVFKGIHLPILLKNLFIKKITCFDNILYDDEPNILLKNIFKKLRLPFNCEIDAKYYFTEYRFDTEQDNIIFYSSLYPDDDKIYYIEKNNFELLERNKIFNEKLELLCISD